MKTLIRLVLVAALFVVFVTWWALESSAVAVIETRRADGILRSTHVWFVEKNGDIWIEAGTPENGWYVDIQTNPRVTLSIDGQSAPFTARVIPGEAGHLTIRRLLREKYGIRDWWISALFDTSRSVAVQLTAQRLQPVSWPMGPGVANDPGPIRPGDQPMDDQPI